MKQLDELIALIPSLTWGQRPPAQEDIEKARVKLVKEVAETNEVLPSLHIAPAWGLEAAKRYEKVLPFITKSGLLKPHSLPVVDIQSLLRLASSQRDPDLTDVFIFFFFEKTHWTKQEQDFVYTVLNDDSRLPGILQQVPYEDQDSMIALLKDVQSYYLSCRGIRNLYALQGINAYNKKIEFDRLYTAEIGGLHTFAPAIRLLELLIEFLYNRQIRLRLGQLTVESSHALIQERQKLVYNRLRVPFIPWMGLNSTPIETLRRADGLHFFPPPTSPLVRFAHRQQIAKVFLPDAQRASKLSWGVFNYFLAKLQGEEPAHTEAVKKELIAFLKHPGTTLEEQQKLVYAIVSNTYKIFIPRSSLEFIPTELLEAESSIELDIIPL